MVAGRRKEKGEKNTFGLKIVFIFPKPIVRKWQIVVGDYFIKLMCKKVSLSFIFQRPPL